MITTRGWILLIGAGSLLTWSSSTLFPMLADLFHRRQAGFTMIMIFNGIGAAVGAVGGFYASKTETEQEIIDQLGGIYLGEKTARPGIPVSGFVFFPEGSYVGVRLVAVEKPGGAATDVFGRMVKPETD